VRAEPRLWAGFVLSGAGGLRAKESGR
jgi:hypothetical protein